jgi:hypothetical protein
MEKNIQKIIWFSASLALFFSVSLAGLANAASLYLTPPSGTYMVGGTFSVKVKINSGEEKINAAEATLVFNPSELSVVKFSKTGSIFSLWTTEPTFSNSAGNIAFAGGTTSNFSGTSGTIGTIVFKAKANASAQVGFSSGSVLAADGKGTNVLGNMNGGVYTLKSKIITPPAKEVPPESEYIPAGASEAAPAAPVLFSTSHSTPNNWYSNNEPEFSWQAPSDITAVKLLISEQPTSLPTVFYSPVISEKKVQKLDDKVWYFHVRFRNKYGWGGITHRKVLIDTEPPEQFEIKIDNGGDDTNPQPILHFKTTDSLSGIEYYEVKIGEQDVVPIIAAALKTNPYKMSAQEPGKHTVIVKAFDKANNFTAAATDVMIEPISWPIITDFPQTISAGEILTIKGTSEYPNADVSIFVEKQGEEIAVNNAKTGKDGNWLYVHPKNLEKGAYQIWAKIIDERGAKSEPTEKITIAVALPTLLKFGKIAIDYLSMIITLIILIIGAIVVIFYSWYRISIWQKRLRKETKEVKKTVTGAFRALQEEVHEQIEFLDKKPGLNKGEKKVRDKLQEALDVSEKFIRKEIRDIEKELE